LSLEHNSTVEGTDQSEANPALSVLIVEEKLASKWQFVESPSTRADVIKLATTDADSDLEAAEINLFGDDLDEDSDRESCIERRQRLASVRSHFMLCYQSAISAASKPLSGKSFGFFFSNSGSSSAAKSGSTPPVRLGSTLPVSAPVTLDSLSVSSGSVLPTNFPTTAATPLQPNITTVDGNRTQASQPSTSRTGSTFRLTDWLPPWS
jgi:hypothetical protein